MKRRTYRELRQLKTFEERFNYLRLDGKIGIDTFGFDRYFNQQFYRSREWKRIRDQVILRDNGCDLGIEGRELKAGRILVHHLNPISLEEIQHSSDSLFDLDNLITVSLATHNSIHYGDETSLYRDPVERKPNDTCPWKQ